ncbi:hypothetical protein JTE90_005708 [Oedothorax gibbosus]|uniref:Uncharacterized protein n=1 Tax=Oedothorax gibbosus TaxID=931172 RepID=A0AAV6UJK9_9ARAC|nr:hypothetical protein JTE90_005708 [Oedothorax gibbosus]
MPSSKAVVVFIAALSFGGVLSKPTVSRGNDGFNYEVSHYPGKSRMHMNKGALHDNRQVSHDPYLNNKGGYTQNPPSDHRPNHHYDDDVKTPIGHPSNEHGYVSNPPPDYRPSRHYDVKPTGHSSHERPEIIHEPQPEYQSPYDSAAKHHYSGNDVYEGEGKPYTDNDAYPISVHDIPIPDEGETYIHPSKKNVQAYPNEYASAPIAQDYVNPHVSHEGSDSSISQEHINPHISQEYVNPPVSQEYIKLPDSHEYANSPAVNHYSHQEPIYQPVSQEPVNQHISQEPLSPPLSQEYIPTPQEHPTLVVYQDHVEPVISQEPIYHLVSQEQPPQVNPHISQSHIKSPVPQEYVSLPVSKKNEVPRVHHAEAVPIPVEYSNSPIEQQHIDPQVSQEYINSPVASQKTVIPSIKTEYSVPSKPIVEPEPVEQVSVPVYDEPSKADYSEGPKYQLVPSGPAYVTNSHSAEIIHPPLPNSHHNSGPVAVPVDDSPSVAEFKPVSVSHAFRLPIPAPSGSHGDNIAPEDHIGGHHPVASHAARLQVPSSGPDDYTGDSSPIAAPISHSTRLNIHSSYPSEETDLESLLPKSQLDVKSPGSFQAIGGDLPPFAPFPQPVADFKSLQLEAEAAGNAPEPVEVDDHSGPSYDAHVQPPISHAFRLSLPSGSIPNLDLPPNPNHGANPVEEKVSSSLSSPHAPLSHAFRLSVPSQGYSQDLSAGDVSKSYESALVESKPKSIKA